MKNNDIKNTILPPLRFAAFKNTEGWESCKIGDFIESHKGGAALTPADFVSHSNREVIPKKAINEGMWLQISKENPTYCSADFYNNNDQSVVDSTYLITTLRDLVPSGPSIGYIVKYLGEKKYILAQGVYGLKIKDTLISDFLIHFSNTPQYRKLMNAVMVGSTQVHIRNGDFLNVPINVPLKAEQQKIAACLTSLDELITAQSQNIEALKVHKKGLMQQLFPADGETVPQLRFAAFQNTEGWEETLLDTLSLKISDGIHTTPVYDDSGEYYFINGNNLFEGSIILDEKTKKVSKAEYLKHKKDLGSNTIFLSINGTIGNVAFFSNEKVILGKSACYINIDESKLDKYFFAAFLQTNKVRKYFESELTGAVIYNLSLKSIKNTIVNLPSKAEQQKIADCLSSLDALITSASDKLDVLKVHKKGLMQQLFPLTNAVE